jgi:hypothetical protein
VEADTSADVDDVASEHHGFRGDDGKDDGQSDRASMPATTSSAAATCGDGAGGGTAAGASPLSAGDGPAAEARDDGGSDVLARVTPAAGYADESEEQGVRASRAKVVAGDAALGCDISLCDTLTPNMSPACDMLGVCDMSPSIDMNGHSALGAARDHRDGSQDEGQASALQIGGLKDVNWAGVQKQDHLETEAASEREADSGNADGCKARDTRAYQHEDACLSEADVVQPPPLACDGASQRRREDNDQHKSQDPGEALATDQARAADSCGEARVPMQALLKSLAEVPLIQVSPVEGWIYCGKQCDSRPRLGGPTAPGGQGCAEGEQIRDNSPAAAVRDHGIHDAAPGLSSPCAPERLSPPPWSMDSGAEPLVFQKARAAGFLSWDVLLSVDHRLGLRGKVVVVKQPMPQHTARQLIAAGAEALIMPLTIIDDAARHRALSSLYRGLAEGAGPALAVAKANSECSATVLACVL